MTGQRSHPGPPRAAESAGSDACIECLTRSCLASGATSRLEASHRPAAERPRGMLALPNSELARLSDERAERAVTAARSAAGELATRGQAGAGTTAICLHSDAYPVALHDLDDAPSVLYVVGDPARLGALVAGPVAAIVGARRASTYGREVAYAMARELSAAGVTVVSGMALGIDVSAHRGALDGGGATIAVLAGGPDRPYPRSHRAIHGEIAVAGAVVAESPPGVEAVRWGFPARNRLIAGLAQVTVIVEATERSGSRHTADSARDLGRPVAAVPGRVTSPLAAGPNALLYDGAHLVRGAQDVLDLLFGVDMVRAPTTTSLPALGAEEATIVDALAAHELTATDLARELADIGIGHGELLGRLGTLELGGWITRGAGGAYSVTVGGAAALPRSVK